MLSNYNQEVIFLVCCFSIKLFKPIFKSFLSVIFVVISQKITLKSNSCMSFACSLLYGCPHARLCRLACLRTYEGEFPNLFPNLLRLSPNSGSILSELDKWIMACNSLSYTPFDSVLLCPYLCVSFDLLKSKRHWESVVYKYM